MRDFDAEIARLNGEIAAKSREVERLEGLVQSIYASTSWRISLPVRVARRTIGFAAYQVLRWPAHMLRPLLLKFAQWGWLRRIAAGVVGKDSAMIRHARLFLFGPTQGDGEAARALALELLDRQSLRIYRRVGVVMLAQQRKEYR